MLFPFSCFSPSEAPRVAYPRLKSSARTRHSRDSSAISRNRTQRRVVADATRGNWIRDFDQFRRQRDLPRQVLILNLQCELQRGSPPILSRYHTVRLQRSLRTRDPIVSLRAIAYSWFALNADFSFQVIIVIFRQSLLTLFIFIKNVRYFFLSKFLHAFRKTLSFIS